MPARKTQPVRPSSDRPSHRPRRVRPPLSNHPLSAPTTNNVTFPQLQSPIRFAAVCLRLRSFLSGSVLRKSIFSSATPHSSSSSSSSSSLVANKVIRVGPRSLGPGAAKHPSVGRQPDRQKSRRRGSRNLVRPEMVKLDGWLSIEAPLSTLRTWTNSHVFCQARFFPWNTHLFVATRARVIAMVKRSTPSAGGWTRTTDLNADLVWKWKWVYSADRSPLSLPSDPHIPHSAPSISRSACRALPALCRPTLPCCWFCGRRRAILPPLALPPARPARPSDRPRISRQMGPALPFRRERVIIESAIKVKMRRPHSLER